MISYHKHRNQRSSKRFSGMGKFIMSTEYFRTQKQVSKLNKNEGTMRRKRKLKMMAHIRELEKKQRKQKGSKEGEIDNDKHDDELNEDHAEG